MAEIDKQVARLVGLVQDARDEVAALARALAAGDTEEAVFAAAALGDLRPALAEVEVTAEIMAGLLRADRRDTLLDGIRRGYEARNAEIAGGGHGHQALRLA
jgi:hypothetical protein